ncbi:hypothetical protein C0J52_00008 [Blattella germanica]|nr:hypothetical protein C0J52_00008 [Blattella germanica]
MLLAVVQKSPVGRADGTQLKRLFHMIDTTEWQLLCEFEQDTLNFFRSRQKESGVARVLYTVEEENKPKAKLPTQAVRRRLCRCCPENLYLFPERAYSAPNPGISTNH